MEPRAGLIVRAARRMESNAAMSVRITMAPTMKLLKRIIKWQIYLCLCDYETGTEAIDYCLYKIVE